MPSLLSVFKRKSKSKLREGGPSSPSSSVSQFSPPSSPSRVRPSQSETHTPPLPPKHDVYPLRETPAPVRAPTLAPKPDPRLSPSVAANNTELASDMRDMTLESPPQLPPLHLQSDSLATTFESRAQPTLIHSATDQPALEAQRSALVDQIASAAKARKSVLTSDGKAAFQAAGLDVAAGSLEVETLFMKPVVQETVTIREHTETTTVIEQHIHRHHVYPKIQPISDPNPIRLEQRHRIFSAIDGKWHEVVGDAAAIAILGEDVFYNGKKEVREDRKMAMGGLGGEVDERALQPRVIEREGIRGEGMGSWHQLQGLVGAETPSMVGEGFMLPAEQMGTVRKTVGIAL